MSFLEFLFSVMMATGSITFQPVDEYLDYNGYSATATTEAEFKVIVSQLTPDVLYIIRDGDISNNESWQWDGTFRTSNVPLITIQSSYKANENVTAFHKM